MNKYNHKYDQQFITDESAIIIHIELYTKSESADITIKEFERILCQAKETLSQQVHKQKTWDQPGESPVVQLEQESSTPSSDQKSLEREQSQRTVKTSNKLYVMYYPMGHSIDVNTERSKDNADIAVDMVDALREGLDIIVPNTFKLQVIDL